MAYCKQTGKQFQREDLRLRIDLDLRCIDTKLELFTQAPEPLLPQFTWAGEDNPIQTVLLLNNTAFTPQQKKPPTPTRPLAFFLQWERLQLVFIPGSDDSAVVIFICLSSEASMTPRICFIFYPSFSMML